MGQHKGTKIHDFEGKSIFLNFEPSWWEDDTAEQSVELASVENKVTSMIVLKSYEQGYSAVTGKSFHIRPPVFIHLTFTEQETDLLIDALQRIKKSWSQEAQ